VAFNSQCFHDIKGPTVNFKSIILDFIRLEEINDSSETLDLVERKSGSDYIILNVVGRKSIHNVTFGSKLKIELILEVFNSQK